MRTSASTVARSPAGRCLSHNRPRTDGERATSTAARTVYRTCHICEVSCGLALDVAPDGTVLRVRVMPRTPTAPGTSAPRESRSAPWTPIRTASAVHWSAPAASSVRPRGTTAFAAVDRLLAPLLDRDRSSVALFTGNPSGHNFAGTTLQPALEAALGSRHVYSVSTIDQMPQVLVAALMYGTPTSVPIADVDRTDYMLIVGANPFVSNGSLGAGPRYPQRLKAIRQRGGTIVVVDPAVTGTARAADRHVQIRPGRTSSCSCPSSASSSPAVSSTSAAASGRVAGLELVRELVAPFEPDAVGARCGIAPATIGEVATGLSAARSAVVYGRTGTTLTRFGTPTSWAIQLLNVLTGNLDFDQAIALHVLQQIAGRAGLKRAVDVFVVVERRQHDDARLRMFSPESPSVARHRSCRACADPSGRYRAGIPRIDESRFATAGFRNHRHVRLCLHQAAQSDAHDQMIVHEKNLNLLCHAQVGTVTTTVVPWPGWR